MNTSRDRESSSSSQRACLIAAHDVAEVGVAKEEREQPDGRADDQQRAEAVRTAAPCHTQAAGLDCGRTYRHCRAPHMPCSMASGCERNACARDVPGKLSCAVARLSDDRLVPTRHSVLDTIARRPPAVPPGQGARRLRPRRRAADRRDRSHLRLRLRAGLRHPRQGPHPHPAVGVLVRAHAATSSPNHLLIDRRRRLSGGAARRTPAMLARPLDAGAQDDAAADRVRRARLSRGLGLEGLPGDRHGLRHHAAGGPARVGPPAGAALHAGDEGGVRARR